MINTVNYLIPIMGLLTCLIVMLTRKVNTRDSICAAKLNLYALGWLILLWADWGSSFVPVFATVLFRLIILINNLLYIKQLTVSKPLCFKTLWQYKIRH